MSQIRQIHSLTPLRGVAALVVTIYHLGFYLPELRSHATYALFYSGYLGVDFFFLLSGFILTHVYGANFVKAVSWQEYRRFIWARLARIYPLHLFVLLLLLVIVSLSKWLTGSVFFLPFFTSNELRFSVESFWSNLFLINNLQVHNYLSWNQQAWSISTEWAAYLLFPFFIPYLVRLPILQLAIASLGFVILWLLEPHFGHLPFALNYGLIRCLSEFLIGIVLYTVYQRAYGRFLLGSDFVMLSLILLLAVVFHQPEVMKFWAVPLFALLILAAAWNTGFFDRLLNTRVFLWLGNISYSIYMLHFLCLEGIYWLWHYYLKYFFGEWFGTSMAYSMILTIMLVTVLMVSWLTYMMVELPARQFLKKWFR